MSLEAHYNNLYNESIKQIKSNAYQTDNLIDNKDDLRSGLSLIIRPSEVVKNTIQRFINQLKAIEPHQYYYPNSDIHITVLSLISCYDEFDISDISTDNYIELIEKSMDKNLNFEVEFRGITASPSCIMVQGFLRDNKLERIRENLRRNFKRSDLKHTIDKRYSIHTAHATISRFRKKLTKTDVLCNFLDANRATSFGTFTVDALELVHNDWYQRKERVKKLHSFTNKVDF